MWRGCVSSLINKRKSRSANKNANSLAEVAKDAKLTKGEAGEAIVATPPNIMRALRGGDDVRLIGFRHGFR